MSSNIRAYIDPLVGCRARVLGQGHYRGRCIGQTGTIRAVWSSTNVAIDLDLMSNKDSTKGYFYFGLSELEILDTKNIKAAEAAEKGENKMQKMTGYLNIAVIHFLNDDTPFRTFECANYTPDLAAEDICVVMSANHGMGLAEVVEIKDRTEGDIFREIVARVDSSEYEHRVEQRKQAAELKAKMQERAKQLQDIVLYQTLAKEDPEMAQMLKDFMALNQ